MFLIFYVIKELANILIRGFTLHKIFGFSTKILAAFLGSLTHFILVLGKPSPIENVRDLPGENMELRSIKIDSNHRPHTKIPIQTRKTQSPISTAYPSSTNLSMFTNENDFPEIIIPKPAPRFSMSTKHKILPDPIEVKAEIHEHSTKIKSPLEYDHISL